MRTVAIIQARSGSERLPGKVLMDLHGWSVLEWVVNRIRAVNLIEPVIDDIVVAIPKGDPVKQECGRIGVKCFEGSEKDVLSRVYKCAKKHKADWILRITADCPLIEPKMVWGLINKRWREYQALAFNRKKIPGGWDAELFSFEWLKKTNRTAKEREHMSKEMRGPLQDYLDWGTDFEFNTSLELNTLEDYERIQEYARLLYPVNSVKTGKKVSR
jgi:spore coat polysaccharide biosynthesis protein SpsF